jgi:hypothetical protein
LFEEREQQNAQKLEKEMPKQREAWLNCTHHPPTVSTQVFEWIESDSNPAGLVQRAVLKSAREETLGDYSESQRQYDAFHNKWDCCEDFGPGNLDDEDEDNYFSPVKIDTNQTHDPPIQSDVRSPSPPPIVEQQPVLEAAPDLMSVI